MSETVENVAAPRHAFSLLRAGLWLALALVGGKAILLGKPVSWSWVPKLASVSFVDALFAVGLGAIGEFSTRMIRPGRVLSLLRVLIFGFMVLSAFYAVIGIGIYNYFHRALTYGLLKMVKGAAVWSSITERLTIGVVIALVCVPAVYYLVAIRGGPSGRRTMLGLGAASIWILSGGLYHRGTQPNGRHLDRLRVCPHVEIVGTTIRGIVGSARPDLPKDYPKEYALELRSHAARGGGSGQFFVPPSGVARPRNAIVIVLESVATKYLSLYGSNYDTTPHLVAESANALVFDHFYSHASYTYCSFVALNFSIYPALPWCYAPWAGRPCPPTMASQMKQRGSRTAYMHNGDLYWAAGRWLLEGKGFDTIEDYRQLPCPPLSSWGTDDRCLIDHLIRRIDEKPGQPFYFVCWTDQTHDPYSPSPGTSQAEMLRDKSRPVLAKELSRYLNTVREADLQLGRVFAALRERGLADDTLVVITGDHGEGFFDPHDNRGHGLTVFEEETHVPFILWNPRLFAGGGRVSTIGGHVDMNPTIADIMGVEPLGEWQGHSLFAPGRPQRTFFMTNISEDVLGVRDGSLKYIFDATNGNELLFDLSSDPEERNDLAGSKPAERLRLRQRLSAWVDFEDKFLRGLTD